jgi:hypothetical protein
MYLNSSQMEQVYSWVHTFKSIDYSHTDPDITDPITIRLALVGNGNWDASQSDIQAISNFASSLITSMPVGGGGYPPGVLATQNTLKAVCSAPQRLSSYALSRSTGQTPASGFPTATSFAPK